MLTFDDIRVEEFLKHATIGDWSDKELYKLAFEYCKGMDLMKLLKRAVDKIDGDVIICNTNCNKKARRSLINSLGKANYKCVYVVSDKDTIIRRDIERDSKTVGQDVIRRFMYNQQIPTYREGFISTKIIYN